MLQIKRKALKKNMDSLVSHSYHVDFNLYLKFGLAIITLEADSVGPYHPLRPSPHEQQHLVDFT